MRHFRLSEVFGPTIQGEGRQAGLPCYFIRFGGCDLRCVWCDTPFAVLPELVAQLPKKTVDEILDQLDILPKGPQWVVLSGGNPATLKLGDLVDDLHRMAYKVMVETQGTIWKDWLADVDELCISPKPPSSTNIVSVQDLDDFFSAAGQELVKWKSYLKVVVFDDADYEYARMIHGAYPGWDFYLSTGNSDPGLPTVGNPNPVQQPWPVNSAVSSVSGRYRWLAEKMSIDPAMQDVRVLPQLHVIAWGNERGR